MKNKIKNLIQDNKYILISGGATLFIILLVYFCYSIIPFGDKTVYRMDLYHQYGPLFSELYDRITSGESLLYSWNTGLGSSFIGNLFNYMSSPFSFIILLFGHDNTFEAIATLIAIKAVLSAMSIAYYFKKSQKSNSPVLIAFGVMYAFCGYFIAYYWNVMWIDSMYLLPLIILGIEKIIDSGKCKSYIVFLTLGILTNYYIGFMLCIFSCIYFLYYYYCSLDNIDKKVKALKESGERYSLFKSFFFQSGVRFAFSSLSVGIILLFILLPVAYVLSSSSATSSTMPTEIKSYFDFFDFLANHLASLEPTIRSSGDDVLPNVYCGLLTVILIPLYIFSNKISTKEKVASVTLLALMYFSFNINIVNFMWHGMHFPNDLPYRQSFMYSFILLSMAYKAFININQFKKQHILTVGIAMLAFIIAVYKIGSKNVTTATFIISIIFTILLTIVLALYTSKKNQAFALSIVLACSVMAETIVANTDHYVFNQSKSSFTEDYDGFKELQAEVDSNDDTLFYRVELSDLRARMDPSWYDYNGVSVFSSMAYESVSKMMKDVGLFGNNINSYTYNPQTPIFNSMFSVKYVYDRKGLISDGDFYSYAYSNSTYGVFENNYMLNIAYPVSNDILDWDTSIYSDPIEAQEEYFRLATGIENVYTKIYDYELNYDNVYTLDIENKVTGVLYLQKIDNEIDGSATAEITATNNGNIYIYVNSRHLDDVIVKSDVIDTEMAVKDGYILDLGYYTIGETVTIEMPISEDNDTASVDFFAFTIDIDKFKQGYEILKSGQLEYTEFTDTCIKGTFSLGEGEILYTSIPYDKGWTIYIDGRKIDDTAILKISDSLLGIYALPGDHEITLEYSIPFLNIANIISLIFTLLLITSFVLKKKKMLIFKNTKPNIWDKAESLIALKIDEEQNTETTLNEDNNSIDTE